MIEIVLVEDNLSHACLIESAFSAEQYHCTVINDGEKAYRYLLQPVTRPDVVIMDYHLPSMNGIDIIKNLNEHSIEYPYIFLTGDTMISTLVRTMKEVALDFMPKTSRITMDLPAAVNRVFQIYQNKLSNKRLEDNLKQNEARYRYLFNNSAVPVTIFDVENKVFLINELAAEILGGKPHEYIGKSITEIYPSSAHELIEQIKLVYRQKGVRKIEQKLEIFGQLRWYLTTIQPLINAQNEITGIQTISIDITQQKNSEELLTQKNKEIEEQLTRLGESEARFRSIFEQAAVGIVHTTTDGRFLRINHRFCEIVGYTEKELQQIPINKLWFAKETEGETKLVQQLLDNQISTYTREKQMVRRNSDIIWISITVSLMRSTDLTPSYFIAIIDDITQRKNNEIELERYRNHLEAILKERTEEIQQILEELAVTNEVLVTTNEMQQTTNRELEKQKHILEQTIEKLQNTQSQLVQSEKMASLGVLTSGIAHEINNPVNFISSSIQGLKITLAALLQLINEYEKITSENAGAKLREIHNLKAEIEFDYLIEGINTLTNNMLTGVNRTTEIIKGLRAFSRLDDDVLILTDIHENLDSTLILVFAQYKDRIELHKNYGNIPKIYCFPSQLNQVFMNILSNAVQSIEGKGTINIKTYKSDNNTISISITDTGCGISEEIQSKIFEPFFTTKEVGKGTGLGLSISYGIIEKHNGKIQFNSKLEHGTEFVITLPVHLKSTN